MAAMEAGARFGMLVAVRLTGHKVRNGHKRAVWLFRCDCGREVTRTRDSVKESHMCSCGCYRPPGRAIKPPKAVEQKPAPRPEVPGRRFVAERHVQGRSFGYAPSSGVCSLEYV